MHVNDQTVVELALGSKNISKNVGEKIVKTPQHRQIVSFLAVTALALAAGCHKKAVPPPPPPPPAATSSPAPTASITVTPSSINPGGSAVLAWRTTDASEISIDGIGTVNAYGTQNVTPTETTNYHLVAKGPGGSTDASASLTVAAAPAAASVGETMNEQLFEQNVKPAFFDYDSYDVRADAQTVLAQDASFLAAHPTVKVVIGGYCDDRGSAEYNLALGQNRANAAKQSLVNGGVSPDRIRTVSYGKEKQFCSQADESCYQQNRRAGFSLDQ
jgi:peptidoglycan-associated lipoprotein